METSPEPCACGERKTRRATRCINCARSEPLTGVNHPAWRGGRVIDKDGYARIYKPSDSRANCGRYMKEHVVVMEEMVGRQLLPHESVHHKNGQRADSRPENLELWSRSQPAGQRVEDKVRWAQEILAQYGNYPLLERS